MPATENTRQKLILALVLCGLVAAFSLFQLFTNPLNYDVSWLVHASSELRAGKTLYKDVMEINPPLIIWLQLPVIFLAEILGLSLKSAFYIYVALALAILILLCGKMLKYINEQERLPIWFVLLVGLFFLLPGWNFGQREHIGLALSLPYVFLIAARTSGTAIPVGLALLVGLLGGIGFAIKPYFLIIPFGLEIYLLFHVGLKKLFSRIEPYMVGLVASLYLLSIWVLTPHYFSKEMLTYATEIYSATFNAPWHVLIGKTMSSILLMLLALLMAFICAPQEKRHIIGTFIVAAMAIYFSVILQGKGWYSHQIFGVSFAMIAIYLAIPSGKSSEKETSPLKVALPIVAVFYMAFCFFQSSKSFSNTKQISFYDPMLEIIQTEPDIDGLFIMSTDLLYGFPLITETGKNWTSRFGALSYSAGVQTRRHELGTSTPLLDEIELYMWDAVTNDLNERKPDLVLVDISRNKNFMRAPYDFVADYSQYAPFKEAWSNYVKTGTKNDMDIFRRRANAIE